MPNFRIRRAPIRSRWSVASLVLVLLGTLVLAGCGKQQGSSSGGADDKPLALTTFTVLADMARQVAGDRIEVASITKPGAEIHGYEPTPSDLKRAAKADLVLQNGLGLEGWFERFISQVRAERVTLTDGITPIPIAGDAGDSEYVGKPNPHAWMSTKNAEVYVDNLVAAFGKLDPGGADEFRRRGEDYKQQVRKVGAFVDEQLGDLPREHRALVTCEGAFAYLARDLGLEEQFIWPVNAEQEGTPQQIAATVRFVRERKVPAIFCESTVSDKAQRQVAREAGSRLAGTLYVDSLSEPDGPVPTYLDLLRVDVETIVAGLQPEAR